MIAGSGDANATAAIDSNLPAFNGRDVFTSERWARVDQWSVDQLGIDPWPVRIHSWAETDGLLERQRASRSGR